MLRPPSGYACQISYNYHSLATFKSDSNPFLSHKHTVLPPGIIAILLNQTTYYDMASGHFLHHDGSTDPYLMHGDMNLYDTSSESSASSPLNSNVCSDSTHHFYSESHAFTDFRSCIWKRSRIRRKHIYDISIISHTISTKRCTDGVDTGGIRYRGHLRGP